MPILLRVAFPGGRYHATPWGRHVNEGVPEWPPSPWRLLRALVAVWKRTSPELPDESVKRVLESLAAPPRFCLPPHRVAHTRHYMPWEKKGPQDRTLVFDTFVSISRGESLLIGWPEAELVADDQRCLQCILKNISVLGRAETMVELSLADSRDTSSVAWNCVPADDFDPNPLPVFCPDPATCFATDHYPVHDLAKLAKGKIKPAEYLFNCPPWHLCLDTETIHAERWPTVPGARWVNYTRPDETRTSSLLRPAAPANSVIAPVQPQPAEKPSAISIPSLDSPNRAAEGHNMPTAARFIIDGPVLPHLTETLAVAEAVRRAAMGCFRRWCERHLDEATAFRRTDVPDRFGSPILSGKDAAGTRLAGPGHAHYWPRPAAPRSFHLGGVTIFARDGFGPAEVAALASLRKLPVGELQELRIQLIGLGDLESLGSDLIGPSTTWRSATPFLGHSKIGVRGRDRFLRKGLRREWRRLAAQHKPLHHVELLAIDALTGEEIAQSNHPQPRQFRRSRPKHGGRDSYRPAAMYRLTFSESIRGPLSLGYGNHFGMGLFVPEP